MKESDILFREIAGREYDPIMGSGCNGRRVTVDHPRGGKVEVPGDMLCDPEYDACKNSGDAFDRLRTVYDFEFWCVTCCNIRDKKSGRIIKFKLNNPQRYVLSLMEDDRLNNRPIRLIMLKARQWGGSTLVQMYMAWIQ